MKQHAKINPWMPIYTKNQVFKCPIKIDPDDVSKFYGYDINWFVCNIFEKAYKSPKGLTGFTLHSIDDYDPRAIFNYAMTRQEATHLCREFMRVVPKTGVTVKQFYEFFCKERDAEYDW